MLQVANKNIVNLHDTEAQILKCKDLKHKIDVLAAEYDRVKKQLLDGHFSQYDEFIGFEGLVLATYKTQNRSQFMQSEFKKDYEELYKTYSVQQPIKVFLIKK